MSNKAIGISLFCMLILPLSKVMASVSNIDLNIQQITLGQIKDETTSQIFLLNKASFDTNPKSFSMLIKFKNNGDRLDNWQIGFYMPRVLYKAKRTNADIILEICQLNSQNCSNLALKKSSFHDNDLSSDFTTILAPIKIYPLEKSTEYIIRILHSNQGQVLRYTAVPQNFFIIFNDQVITLPTTQNTYRFLNYNAESVRQDIKHNSDMNWRNSSTSITDGNIIPSPSNFRKIHGVTKLTNNIVIINKAPSSIAIESFISDALMHDLGIKITPHTQSKNQIIIQHIDLKQINNNPEGYTLIINNGIITVGANNNTGLFYGFITLRQIWNQNHGILPNLEIKDYPRFKFRGLLLDVARHYFTIDQIKQIIDIMSTHKLNTLHLHLSDDEAFRLEIPAYPNLTAIGSVRGFNQKIIGTDLQQQNLNKQFEENLPNINTKYGEFYTANQLTDITKYANERAITIIPEVEIPVHARAILKANPEIFFNQADYDLFMGSNYNMLPVCKYDTNPEFQLAINQIILTTDKIFSNQTTLYYLPHEVSVGGDEVSKYAWVNSPVCKNWEGLTALQKEHLFYHKLSLNSNLNPIKFSGWHELIQNDDNSTDSNTLTPSRTGHIWVWKTFESGGLSSAINLTNLGYNTVAEFADLTYFDNAYTPDINEPGFSWATQYSNTYSALRSAVAISTIIKNKATKNPNKILGIEGAIWTDVIPDYNDLIYMSIPKMAGLAEAAWAREEITTNSNYPNWLSLSKRLGCGTTGFLTYLNKIYGIKYRGYPNGIALEAPKACHK